MSRAAEGRGACATTAERMFNNLTACFLGSGDDLAGTSLAAESYARRWRKMRRDESRRGRQECLRHVSGADHQQLSGCFLESGDDLAGTSLAAESSARRWRKMRRDE